MGKVSGKTIARLSHYRYLLNSLQQEGLGSVFSHELAAAANCSSTQVRRDLMVIKYEGSPVHGYRVQELIESIDDFLDHPHGQRVGLVGVGNLGRAILSHFQGRRPKLPIVAAFDVHPERVGKVIAGTRCYHMDQLERVVSEQQISVAIICVPAENAHQVAAQLVDCGVRGLLNFSPIRLKINADVFVEDVDITSSLEKVAYFSRQRAKERGV